MAIIEVEHLTKEYRLGQLETLKTTLRNQIRRLTGQPAESRPLFRALDDVSFSIEQGEVVGIIGHNGAGKSTLLKLLANITSPTSGRTQVNGRIAPLIEVGAGFVPDLTGRENVYLNGSILGLSRKAIQSKFEEIVEFAEMSEFIDTPVKRYSSGMKVKLAFSVATSIDSEVLIVDEVLAVGDLAFQRKCFDRMEQLIRRQGKTVLLVSHNIRQVQRLCSRVIMMDHGQVAQDGPSKEVCNAFFDASDQQIHRIRSGSLEGRTQSSGDIEIRSVDILDDLDHPVSSVTYQQNVTFRITYHVRCSLPEPIFGVGIHTTDFFYLSTSQSVGHLSPGPLQPGLYTLTYRVRRFPFLPGVYALRLGVALSGTFQPVLYSENVLPILVKAAGMNRAIEASEKEGFIAMEGDWSLAGHEDTESVRSGMIPMASSQPNSDIIL